MNNGQKLVIEILPLPGHPARRHVTALNFPFIIGRSYACDLILDDPHVSPAHLRIDKQEGRSGWMLHDLGSDNGLFINNVEVSGRSVPVLSGDEIMIGRTRMRLFSETHPVADTLPVPHAHGTLALMAKPLNALTFFFIAVAGITLWTWLEVWSSDNGFTVAMLVLSTVLVMLVWTGIWAMAGRIIRHRSGFFEQLTLCSAYVVAAALGFYLLDYLDFLTNGGRLFSIISQVAVFLLVGGIIGGALGIATEMPRKKRNIAAALFAGGLILGSLGISALTAKAFHLEPDYPWVLKPYLSSLAPGTTPAGFISGSDKLFDSSKLKIKKKKGDPE